MDDLDRPYQGRFVGREHRFALRVYFEDTDFSGVVYHARYLHFLERARSDMLRAAGIDQRDTFASAGGAYAVAEMKLKFRSPAKFDDELLVTSRVTRIRAAACTIEQAITRRNADDTAHLLFQAQVVAALVGPDGRPRRQPKGWTSAFEAILTDPTWPE